MKRPLLLMLLLILQVGMRANEDDKLFARVLIPPGMSRLYVHQAIQGAKDRLEDPTCLKVLDDFTDEQGFPLSMALSELHQTPGARLLDLIYVDATDDDLCDDLGVGAFTSMRGRVIYMCAERFASAESPLTGIAGQILVIHELLHSLGLPEYPSTPEALTSAEITRRVWARCGGGRSEEARNRHNRPVEARAQTKSLIRVAARPGILR